MDISEIIEARRMVRGAKPRRRSRRPKTMRSVRARKPDELIYRRDLMAVVNLLMLSVQKELLPLIKEDGHEFLRDSLMLDAFSDRLEAAMENMRAEFATLESYATLKATGFITRLDRTHQFRYFDQLRQTVGIDMQGIVETEGLQSVLNDAVANNVKLIESIPQEYFADLESMIHAQVLTGSTSAATFTEQLIPLIEGLGEKTAARAKFIARDQTAKLNAAMNQERNLALGIKEYVWMATGGRSGDGRTRKNHREKHGLIFRFDDPPSDTGNPGQDFQCRCTARPIVPGL